MTALRLVGLSDNGLLSPGAGARLTEPNPALKRADTKIKSRKILQ